MEQSFFFFPLKRKVVLTFIKLEDTKFELVYKFVSLIWWLKANSLHEQVLAATQTPGEAGMKWFQGTADAVRKFTWVFEVCVKFPIHFTFETKHSIHFFHVGLKMNLSIVTVLILVGCQEPEH